MAYDIQGTFYEACDCEIICSCWAQIEPDMGQCTGLWAWDVTQGNYTNTDGSDVSLVGVKVVILTNGKSCDDATNKLIIIDPNEQDQDKASKRYAAAKEAVTQAGAWSQVFNHALDAATKNQAAIQAVITITPDGINAADIVVTPVENGSVKVSHVVANTSFEMEDDKDYSVAQISGTGRLLCAVVGSNAEDVNIQTQNGGVKKKRGTIDVGQTVAKDDLDTPNTVQGLNLLAEIPGYTFDLDIVRASAARGKFHYVHKT